MNKTNFQFAASDKMFRFICNILSINPTRRQASKWRNKKDSAFKHQNEAIKINKKRIAKDRMDKAISTALCHMDCLDVNKWDELAEKAIHHYNMI